MSSSLEVKLIRNKWAIKIIVIKISRWKKFYIARNVRVCSVIRGFKVKI